MKHKIRINKGRVFSGTYRVVLTVVLVCGMMAMVVEERSELGFALLILQSFLLMILWTSFRILEIDVRVKNYTTYVAVMARPFGRQTTDFHQIKAIRIDKNHSKSSKSNFMAWLDFDSENSIPLVSDETEAELREKLEGIAQKLSVPIKSS